MDPWIFITSTFFFLERAPSGAPGAPGARPPLRFLSRAPGAPGAQPPLRGALSFFRWKGPQDRASEGFWALSRQQGPGPRGPRGALGPQGPLHKRAPGAPEGARAPCIWGPNLGPLGPLGPNPPCGFQKKKKSRKISSSSP